MVGRVRKGDALKRACPLLSRYNSVVHVDHNDTNMLTFFLTLMCSPHYVTNPYLSKSFLTRSGPRPHFLFKFGEISLEPYFRDTEISLKFGPPGMTSLCILGTFKNWNVGHRESTTREGIKVDLAYPSFCHRAFRDI